MGDSTTVTHSTEPPRETERAFYRFQPWIVVLSAALFFFYEFIQMNMFNAIDPYLIQSFKVNATRLGNLSATYFYGNVLFLFATGMLLDRFSTRKIIITAMCVCVACTYLFAISAYIWQAEIFRFITGIASTCCMLSVVRLASRWLPPRRVALAVGLSLTFAMTGGLIAQTPMTFLAHWLGWRHAVMVNATLGAFFIVIIFLLVRDYPKGMEMQRHIEKAQLKELGFRKAIVMAMRNKQNWFAGLYTNFISFPIVILGAAWGSLYLMHTRNITHLQSTYITSMIFIGALIGFPLVGWLSDFIGRRKLPMIVGSVLSLLVMSYIVFMPSLSMADLIVAFLLLGFITSCQVISYPLVVESNSRMITTTAEGLACTIIMSAGLFQVVYGWLVNLTWDGTRHFGVPVYTAHNYNVAALLFPAVFIAAIVISFFIKETFCEHNH